MKPRRSRKTYDGWALWNYDHLHHVARTRHECRSQAFRLMGDDRLVVDWLKSGVLEVTRVSVSEILPKRGKKRGKR